MKQQNTQGFVFVGRQLFANLLSDKDENQSFLLFQIYLMAVALGSTIKTEINALTFNQTRLGCCQLLAELHCTANLRLPSIGLNCTNVYIG